jgi:Phytanoyl-CoA dioxygenase (PhyH)
MSKLAQIGARLKAVTDSRYRNFFWQRAFTDLDRRERKASARAAALPAHDAKPSPEDAKRATALDANGFVMLDGVIPKDWLHDLYAYLAAKECGDIYRPALPKFVGPENAPAGTHVAFFSNEIVARAPHVFDIVNNPAILNPVAAVLGAKPTASYMAAWWSIPAHDGIAQHAEKYHRDVDDWRFIKMFCYLTDVDEESGPHVYVPGSHKVNKLTPIRRYDEKEVYEAFGPDCEKRFTGPAGTAFLENTYGFHRGFPPKSKPRMLFQVLYSLTPVIYGPKTPIATIGQGGVPASIDTYVNRVYCRAA